MDDAGPARQGRAARAPASSPAASQNEIYEIRRGDLHGALRIPPPTAPEPPRRRHPPRVADHRGARRHRRAAHRRPSPCAPTPSVLGRTFYLMGFVDGWSPMDVDELAGAVRHRPRGPQGPRLPARRGHRPAGEGRLAGQGPRRTSAGPTASTSARSTAGPRSSSASRAASCPASTRPRPGCAPTSRSTTSPGSCTATTSSPT